MKKKNFVIMFTLAFVLLCLPITTNAAEQNNYNDDVMTMEARTRNQLIRDYGVTIRINTPYVSKIFRPRTNQIEIQFGVWGASGTYTYYVEKQNSNGTWTEIYSNTVRHGSSSTRNVDVTPNNAYRVRATTNDPYSDQMFIEVYEYI